MNAQVTRHINASNVVLTIRQEKFYSQSDSPKRNDIQPLWKVIYFKVSHFMWHIE